MERRAARGARDPGRRAESQEEQTTKLHERQEQHVTNTGDNVLAREQQWAAQTAQRAAATVGLTVVNVLQLGADPITDGLEVGVIAEMLLRPMKLPSMLRPGG